MPDKPPRAKPINSPKKRPNPLTTTQRGYGHRHHQKLRDVLIAEFPMCQYHYASICTGWSEQLHHENGNTQDNRRENCKMVCGPCHREWHRQLNTP